MEPGRRPRASAKPYLEAHIAAAVAEWLNAKAATA
jgi:hypothetical protein